MGGFCLTYETSRYLQWFPRYRWKQFLIRFQQNWLLSPTSHYKELKFKICSTIHVKYHLLLFLVLIFVQNKCSCILIWEHFVNSNFCQKGHERQNSNLQKYCQKLFPSVYCEPMKVPWFLLCQTKSPHVEIKWLKGYCISSTFMENIPDQIGAVTVWLDAL